jgi:hypothetical protein
MCTWARSSGVAILMPAAMLLVVDEVDKEAVRDHPDLTALR